MNNINNVNNINIPNQQISNSNNYREDEFLIPRKLNFTEQKFLRENDKEILYKVRKKYIYYLIFNIKHLNF
jgi:hypothetical protein